MTMMRALLAIVAATFPLTAIAATMTFDDGAGLYQDTDGDDLYVENGIAVTGFDIIGLTFEAERAHLDNFGGPYTNRLSFTYVDWFDLVSLEIWPITSDGALYGLCGLDPCPAYDNVVLIGYRGATVAAQLMFPMGSVPSLRLGGELFTSLTRLEIWAPAPSQDTDCCDIHFEVDNVVLARGVPAPVPLPAGLPLIAAGLGGLALIRRRRA